MTTTISLREPTDDLTVVEHLDGERWRPQAGWSRVALVTWWAVPVATSFAATYLVAQVISRPRPIALQVVWFVGLSVVASAVLQGLQRLLRGVLSLAVLLRLDLAFPSHAPRRYQIAVRSRGTRTLLQRLHRSSANDTPGEAAELLLQLVAALSQHDRALRGHSARVRAYSELVAEQLGLDEAGRQGLRWAGLLHDVGKLEISATILNKTGQLTEDEWELIRRHPDAGARLCAPLAPWLGEWASGVRDHHERWEGGGYPRGIAGSEISLAGRVVAVTDAFDVMTSARSYKKPRPVDQALAELVSCSGSQFDPMVVRAFLAISIPRLRAIVGPLIVAPIAMLKRQLPTAATVIENAGIAVCVACVAGLLVPVGGASRAGSDGSVPSRGSAGAHARADGATDGAIDGATGGAAPSVASATGSPTGVRHGGSLPRDFGRGGLPASASGHGGRNASGDPHLPSDGGDPPPPDPGPNPTTLIINPRGGSVSIDGAGPDGSPPVTIVGAPGTGHAVCGASPACQPITVPLPI